MVSDAMKAWESFPPLLQRVVAKQVDGLLKRGRIPLRYKGIYKFVTLILIAHDNRKNRRWYDKDKLVQRTINTLSFAEHSGLVDLAYRIIQVRTHLRSKEINAGLLSEKELARIVDTVFENPNIIV